MLMALNKSMQQKQTVKFVNKDKSLFYQTVKANVNQYFTDHHISKYGNAKMYFKSFVLLTAYLGAFALILIFNPPFSASTWHAAADLHCFDGKFRRKNLKGSAPCAQRG